MYNIWRKQVREHVNNWIYIIFDRAKWALKACTPLLSIQKIEFVFREMLVCICQETRGNFSQSGVSPVDTQILGMSLIEVLVVYNGQTFCFLREFRHHKDQFICIYWVHSAGSFSSCHLTSVPLMTVHLSVSVEPSPSNNLWLHNSHSLLQYKRSRKKTRTEQKTPHVHFAWSLQWIVAWTQRLVRSLRRLHPVQHRH